MDIFSSLILGAVQGLTEFLPVSSTGHLIIARDLLGLSLVGTLSFDAVLHFATAFAVLIYFRKDFVELFKTFFRWVRREPMDRVERNLMLALIIGTAPGVFFGLMFQGDIETIFRNVHLVAWALIGGSVLFLLAEYVSKKLAERQALGEHVSLKQGLIIGFFQALALIPGVSRSGSTISGGLLLGLSREQAARFAFLLSFPIILGAGSKSLLDLETSGFLQEFGFSVLVGAVAAFITGIFAIHYLLKYLKNHTLGVFVVYRLALAVVILFFL